MRKKRFYIVFAICLAAVVAMCALGCDKTPAPTEKTTYTVTVTCAESELPDIDVSLYKGDNIVQTKPLTDGKAVFQVESDTYTVKLTGVPDTYEYSQKIVTADIHEVTIELIAKEEPAPEEIRYSVTVLFPDGNPAARQPIQLCTAPTADGNAGSCYPMITDDNGVANKLLPPDTYEVHIIPADLPSGFAFDDSAYKVTVESPSTTAYIQAVGTPEPAPEAVEQDFYGSWRTLDGKTFNITVNANATVVNAEPVDRTFANNTLSFSLGNYKYSVIKHEYADAVLILKYGATRELLVPANGYSLVTLSSDFKGTWTNPEQPDFSFYLRETVFNLTQDGKTNMGYVLGLRSEGTYSRIFAVIADETDPANPVYGAYELVYNISDKTIDFGDKGEFSRTGLGTESDPFVLENLIGDYRYDLKITEFETENFGRKNYTYEPFYLSYIPSKEESYVVGDAIATNIDEQLSLTIGVPSGANDDGSVSYNNVLSWVSALPENGWENITLAANTEYIFIIGAYPESSSVKPLSPCKVGFKVKSGDFEIPAKVEVPSDFTGTWYGEDDKTDTITFTRSCIYWQGDAANPYSLENGALTATFGDKTYTFSADLTSLTVTSEGESKKYTAISPNPVSISNTYEGIWKAKDGRLLAFDITQQGSDFILNSVILSGVKSEDIKILGTVNNVFEIKVLIKNEIYIFSRDNGSNILMTSASESVTFTGTEYVSSFNDSYYGIWSNENITVSISKSRIQGRADSFIYNGKTVSIWKNGDDLLFYADTTIYKITLEANNLILTDYLDDSVTITLTKK